MTKTEEKIIDAMTRTLRLSSMERISVTALCNQADINRTTFYMHYESVGEVYTKLYRPWLIDKCLFLRAPIQEPYPAFEAELREILEILYQQSFATDIVNAVSERFSTRCGNRKEIMKGAVVLQMLREWIGNNFDETVDRVILQIRNVIQSTK